MATNYNTRLLEGFFGAPQHQRAERPDPYAPLQEQVTPRGPVGPPAFNPLDPFPTGVMPNPGVPAPTEQAPEDARGFLQRFTETPGMGLGLMQLGAGLASGRNWGEGVGRGFSGMADTLQKQQALEADEAYKRQYLLAKAQGKQGTDKEMKRYTFMVGGKPVEGYASVTQQGMLYTDVNGQPLDPSTVEAATPYQAPSKQKGMESQMFIDQGKKIFQDDSSATGWRTASGEEHQAQDPTPWSKPADPKDPMDSVSRSAVNLRWLDPKTGMEMVRAARYMNGDYFLKKDGKWVDAEEVTGTPDYTAANRSEVADVETGAGGIPNAVSYNEATGTPSFKFQRESEAKDYQFGLRTIAANRELEQLVKSEDDFNNLASLGGAIRRYAANNADAGITSTALSAALKDSGYSDGDVARMFSSPAFRFLQGVLRIDTGAAYTGTEIQNYWSAFLPTTGDTVDQWYQKGDARQREISALIGRTGKAAPYLAELQAGKRELPGSVLQMPRLTKSSSTRMSDEELDAALGI